MRDVRCESLMGKREHFSANKKMLRKLLEAGRRDNMVAWCYTVFPKNPEEVSALKKRHRLTETSSKMMLIVHPKQSRVRWGVGRLPAYSFDTVPLWQVSRSASTHTDTHTRHLTSVELVLAWGCYWCGGGGGGGDSWSRESRRRTFSWAIDVAKRRSLHRSANKPLKVKPKTWEDFGKDGDFPRAGGRKDNPAELLR